MAVQPPVQPGQLSPDGMWRWDGVRWVPAVAAPYSQAPRRSRNWIWWVAGGCAIVLVLALVGAGIGVYNLVNSFQHGGLACLPSDFPSYPGATVISENTYVGTGVAPGDSKRCSMVLRSNDDSATVTSFYQDKLNGGDWKVTAYIASIGQIQFQRVSRQQSVGVVELLGRGNQTEIRIQLDS
ncbi:MAG: hypothetical protein E6J40_01115 [Chloroflexi bacterium]|nr:MAG: hypothetical protein E6J40_01115 [Chloroflexota bacterium]